MIETANVARRLLHVTARCQDAPGCFRDRRILRAPVCVILMPSAPQVYDVPGSRYSGGISSERHLQVRW